MELVRYMPRNFPANRNTPFSVCSTTFYSIFLDRRTGDR